MRPASRGSDTRDGLPSMGLGEPQGDDRLVLEQGGNSSMSRAASRREGSDVHEINGCSLPSSRTAPDPVPPSRSVQLPSSPSLSVQLPPVISSLGKECAPCQAPPVTRRDYEHLSHDRIHKLCTSARQGVVAPPQPPAGPRLASRPNKIVKI